MWDRPDSCTAHPNLGERGSYEGFDVFSKGISWCQENITPRYPNFRFRVADIHNKEYNPGGKFAASEYELSYDDASFDFVFLTSVFTHLLPDEVDNYLSEIRRVLAHGGRCLASFFLLNEESLGLLRSGSSTIDFKYDFGEYRTKSASTPEAAVAYPEDFIRSLYTEHGLMIADPLRILARQGRFPQLPGHRDLYQGGRSLASPPATPCPRFVYCGATVIEQQRLWVACCRTLTRPEERPEDSERNQRARKEG